MEQIKKETKNESALLEKFGADERYNPPDSYSEAASFYGNGRYPPDWAQRRNVIWWLQDSDCGRCGRKQANEGHVHHIKPLADGGHNGLDNLVGLCADCHALLHPTVSDLNGSWEAAPKFPCENAQPEVAVIKHGRSDSTIEGELRAGRDFEKLSEETAPGENSYASRSPAVYETSATVARQFPIDPEKHPAENYNRALEQLSRLLLLRGRVPENGLYDNRRLKIDISLAGLLGWLSPFEPDVDIDPTGTNDSGKPYRAVSEEVERDGSADREVLFSEDVTEATVTVRGGDGEVTRESVSFGDGDTTQSLSVSVSPPPLSISTAGAYVWSAARKSHLLTAVYAILWLLVVPVTGLVLLCSTIGVIFGTVGTLGWLVIAALFGGSWSMVAELAVATIVSLIVSSIAIAVLEQFGIDLGE